MVATTAAAAIHSDEDSAKRRQILDGARAVFLEFGFDGASMGEIARAAGVSYDVRKAFPYNGYETYDFEVPTLTEADCYARFKLRIAEMHESLKIVKQCLDRMPEGPIRTPVPRYPHFRVEPGEIFFHTENPRGDYALYMISKGGTEPYRMRLRSPCLCNLMALKPMLRGGASDEELRDAIAAVWRAREDRYSEIRTAETAARPKVEMSYIGG